MSEYHTPVLLEESVTALITNPSGIYVDATYGGGGHTAGILSRLSPDGRVIAFDRDGDALGNRMDDPRLTLIRTDFRYLHNFVMYHAWETSGRTGQERMDEAVNAKVDGIMADLGVSSHQFDTPARGFSFRFDAPLDMRMNTESAATAADIVNGYSIEALERILRVYGEVDNAGRTARLIVSARSAGEIRTTGDLDKAIAPVLPACASHKVLAKIYQALRIEVNHELRSLEKFLEGCIPSLKEGGRMAVITYHSIEDRMVKNFIRAGNAAGIVEKDFYGNMLTPFKALNRKPILPQESEIAGNTRARSAKLRTAERCGTETGNKPLAGKHAQA